MYISEDILMPNGDIYLYMYMYLFSFMLMRPGKNDFVINSKFFYVRE